MGRTKGEIYDFLKENPMLYSICKEPFFKGAVGNRQPLGIIARDVVESRFLETTYFSHRF